MKRYRHLFFDLDHTLWDLQSNSRETLRELFIEERLADQGVSDAEEFISSYEEVNDGLWGRYEAGKLNKEVLRVLRFRNALLHFGIKNSRLSDRLSRAFLDRCPTKAQLMPGTLGLLKDLGSHYSMHIITNGFEEVQALKVQSSGIAGFFTHVISSEKAGARKPDPRIFAHALKHSGARDEECLMIGDNMLADMLGARQAGWDHVHFAAACEPDPEATYNVRHMDELRPILLS